MNNFFDQNLQYLLNKKGVSPEKLADDLQVSITGSKIYVGDLLKIAQYFRVSVDQLIQKDLKNTFEKRKDIKLLILDVDGVLTTGGMYFSAHGDEIKQFNTKDGRGIISFVKGGGQIGIISSGFKDEIIQARAKMLGIQHVYVGKEAKENILAQWIEKLNINWSEIAYIGDDINDLDGMQKVGLSACPSDAVDEIKQIAHVQLVRGGGQGCVREFIGNYLCDVTM